MEMNNGFKNNLRVIRKDQESSEFKRKRNATNKFLNTNLKAMVSIFILIFMGISFKFFILPKFKEASSSSNVIVEQRKTEFVEKYVNFQNYKNLINDFSKVESSNVYKIEKMIPETYSQTIFLLRLLIF